MCDLIEEIRQEAAAQALAQGREEARIDFVHSMLREDPSSITKAARITGLSEEAVKN